MVKKYLANGDEKSKIETIEHLQKNFRSVHVCRPIRHCGFCRPGLNEAFEVVEPIAYSIGLFGEKKIIKPGVYRIIFEIPSPSSHSIILQKFKHGRWSDQFYVDGGWAGPNGMVIDWRGIHSVIV